MTCLASPILQPLFDGRPRKVHTQRVRWLVHVAMKFAAVNGAKDFFRSLSTTCHTVTVGLSAVTLYIDLAAGLVLNSRCVMQKSYVWLLMLVQEAEKFHVHLVVQVHESYIVAWIWAF